MRCIDGVALTPLCRGEEFPWKNVAPGGGGGPAAAAATGAAPAGSLEFDTLMGNIDRLKAYAVNGDDETKVGAVLLLCSVL